MQFDEDYHCPLSQADLQRIIKLPDAVNLAMPFLRNLHDLNAHRLMGVFVKEKGETHFRKRDFLGAGAFAGLDGDGDGEDGSTLGGDETVSFVSRGSRGGLSEAGGAAGELQKHAEKIYETLVKESLRARLRGIMPDDPGMCVCVYVCVYFCMRVCIFVCVYVCVYWRTPPYTLYPLCQYEAVKLTQYVVHTPLTPIHPYTHTPIIHPYTHTPLSLSR
jgi:hypothetical protein